MPLVIEPGRPADAWKSARLIVETDVPLFSLYGGGDLRLWTDISEREWQCERGIYGCATSHAARLDGELVGLPVSYSPSTGARIDWSLATSKPTFEPARWDQFDSLRSLSMSLFPSLPKAAYYVQNIAVQLSVRGNKELGVARQLMEVACTRAREERCRSCHLDLNESNLAAARFYEKFGFKRIVRTEVPDLPGIAAHYRMAFEL